MKIAIWGTGVYGMNLIEYMEKLELFPVVDDNLIEWSLFLDNAVGNDNESIKGLPVCKPSSASLNNVSVVIIAVKNYQNILEQLKFLEFPSEKVCFYNPAHKLIFLNTFVKITSLDKFYAKMKAYTKIFNVIDYVAANLKSRDDALWESIFDKFGNVSSMTAVEELGDVDLCKYLYANMFSKFLSKSNGKTIGIYYHRFYNGGVERVISQLIPIFLELGFKVVLITDEISPEKDYECPLQVARVLFPKNLGDKFEFYQAWDRILKQYNIDIVYLHEYYGCKFTTMFVPFLCRCGKKTLIHTHIYHKSIEIIGAQLTDLIPSYKLADRVIVLSREDERFFRSKGARATYIPNPVNLDIPYMYHAKKSERPIIVWVGRIEPIQKQVYETVRIVKELIKAVPSVLLKIIGMADNPEVLKKLKRLIQEASLEDNFVFCGFKQNPWEECKDADAFLMTSDYEGFPLVLTESKMAGIPAVVYSLPYLEVLKDGKGYIEVAQKDAKGAARELEKIIGDKTLQERLSKEARESIEYFAKFDISGAWANVLVGK